MQIITASAEVFRKFEDILVVQEGGGPNYKNILSLKFKQSLLRHDNHPMKALGAMIAALGGELMPLRDHDEDDTFMCDVNHPTRWGVPVFRTDETEKNFFVLIKGSFIAVKIRALSEKWEGFDSMEFLTKKDISAICSYIAMLQMIDCIGGITNWRVFRG